jgi:predicted enzyme related to lactoylglutathione lyase
MNTIRHIAIKTEDTMRLASFYMKVFGLKELHRENREGGYIFLTDGYFNLALLPNDSQNCQNGLYHFGFQVDDADRVIDTITELGMSKAPKPRPKDRPYAEVRASDPDGNYFDISEQGFLEVQEEGKRKT